MDKSYQKTLKTGLAKICNMQYTVYENAIYILFTGQIPDSLAKVLHYSKK